MQGQAVAARTVTLQLGAHAPTGRGNNRYSQRGWYLSREGDLANVTNEAENPALGILSLTITAPTPNQYATGIICKVAMESLTG
jgi:hypothetical protein